MQPRTIVGTNVSQTNYSVGFLPESTPCDLNYYIAHWCQLCSNHSLTWLSCLMSQEFSWSPHWQQLAGIFDRGGKTVYGRQEMLQSEIRTNLKQLLVLSCVSIFTSEALCISCLSSPVYRFLMFEQRQKLLHSSSQMETRNAKYVGHFRTKWTRWWLKRSHLNLPCLWDPILVQHVMIQKSQLVVAQLCHPWLNCKDAPEMAYENRCVIPLVFTFYQS